MIKKLLKKFIPFQALQMYHKFMAYFAAFWYRNPSEKLIVIGITGTNGKSSTIDVLAHLLESAGYRVGVTSTVKFKVAEREWLNDKKMTMLGRFQTQRLLKEMVDEKCDFAIVETTSQGIEQFRHIAVNYDVVVFTNLTPEHIEAHGGFENYKLAKGKLFKHLMARSHKTVKGKHISKVSVVNIDDDHADFFLGFNADWKYGFGIEKDKMDTTLVKANDVQLGVTTTFEVNAQKFETSLPGLFNVYNLLTAITVARHFDITWQSLQQAVKNFEGIPGRMERIDSPKGVHVIVDYAYEPKALEKVYEVLNKIKKQRILQVLGSCGGGRDVARRPILGKIAAQNAEKIYITNEDPYDDDPRMIMDQIAEGAHKELGSNSQNIQIIEDRREAIRAALLEAQPGDMVLVTGKGSEQAMVVGDKLIPWDDRVVVKELIKELGV